jgi:hypothetical protein
MNYQTANLILDRVVDGESYPLNIVNKALEMTGDLNGLHEGMRSQGVDYALSQKDAGNGKGGSNGLVD